MGLLVYHVLDEIIKAEADPDVWEEQIGMMEMVLDTHKLSTAVEGMREKHSKYKL